MKVNRTVFGALLVASVFLFGALATAQTTSPPNATAPRPATTPSGQTSLPTQAPPATATQKTGEVSRDPVVKRMNEDEKKKVDIEGK
ncbi:MAG: hypothetical protein ACJ8EF_08755 [Bradyrhizobium sp.]|jgi:hypothetical protein